MKSLYPTLHCYLPTFLSTILPPRKREKVIETRSLSGKFGSHLTFRSRRKGTIILQSKTCLLSLILRLVSSFGDSNKEAKTKKPGVRPWNLLISSGI